MGKACLVTGKSGPLLVEIVRQAADRQRQVLVTRSGRMDLGQTDEETTSTFSWNRRSAISARSAVLHATNLYGALDEAIVIFAPTSDTETFHESSIGGIENRVDSEVKGYIYILREILGQMVKQGSGRVVLVLQQPPDELQSPLEAVGVAGFAALADALGRYYRNEPVVIDRFRTQLDDPAGFTEFLFNRIDRGRTIRDRLASPRAWLRYPPGPRFLKRRALR